MQQVDLNRKFLNNSYRLAMLPLVSIIVGAALILLGNFGTVFIILAVSIIVLTFLLFLVAVYSPSLSIYEDHLVVRPFRRPSFVIRYSEVLEIQICSAGSGFIRLSTSSGDYLLSRVLFKNERGFIRFVSDKIPETDEVRSASRNPDGAYEPTPRLRRVLYGSIPGLVGFGVYLFCRFLYPEYDSTRVFLGALIALVFGLYIARVVEPR